jgi:fermentation-respiration switch protein FrsA (DUF1100 family)
MLEFSKIDFSALDRPEVLMVVFHPRKEWITAESQTQGQDILIPVEEDVMIGCRFHMAERLAPNILFFHGNGEIVADYDEIGPIYNRIGINFMPVDYRGYGRSTGTPTITAMMRDAYEIYSFVKVWLRENGYLGPFILMGRSLGSASALELAANCGEGVDGLIIESGFAYVTPLLRLLGIDIESQGFKEEKGFRNVDKIRSFDEPTLIIHAEKDHIIPFSEGQTLYDACRSADKTLLTIPGANHNDIFFRGASEYMNAVKVLADTVRHNLAAPG